MANITVAAGQFDDSTSFAGVTVYLDTNNNGVKDKGEPTTTTTAQGAFTHSSTSY